MNVKLFHQRDSDQTLYRTGERRKRGQSRPGRKNRLTPWRRCGAIASPS